MKTYEFVDFDLIQKLKVTEGEKVWWVTPNSESPRWKEYLRYQDWISQGNNPEDFWNQDDTLSNT